jgi:hypothetical protein
LSGIANSIRLPGADDGPWAHLAHVRPNKAFKLTRSHGLCRMEALRATMRWLRGPSQLNAMFCGPQSDPEGRQ